MPTTTRTVSIVGPNLRDQSRGDFHVHAAGCADLQRDRNLRGHTPWTIDVAYREDVAEAVYEDMITEGESPADYLGEFHFAPCLDGLPTRRG